jgi:hypothetical protein
MAQSSAAFSAQRQSQPGPKFDYKLPWFQAARRARAHSDSSPIWREKSAGRNRRYLLGQLDLIVFDAGHLAFVKVEMLRVEGIFLDQLDTVAFNLFHNADMLVVGVDDFHMFADIHSLSP